MLTGPWPEALCMLGMFADVLFFSATLTYLAIIAILKAFFIVYFKNVWALKVTFFRCLKEVDQAHEMVHFLRMTSGYSSSKCGLD